MADTKITALTALTAADPANDVIPIVDVSDTSMAASGTTKKISVNNILGASGTATLASATITGDLTVDTSTLKVDSANNRVGIGTASPLYTLDVAGDSRASSFKIGAAADESAFFQVSGGCFINNNASRWLAFGTNNTERLRIDTSGNVGIGVAPSAWASNYKSVQVNPGGGFAGKTDALLLAQNCYFDGTNWVNNRASTFSSRYDMNVAGNGVHAWYVYNASFGTVGNTIPFTQAMTLDANGNLLVGKTATNLQVVGCELKANGTVFSTLVDTTDAAASSYQLYSTGAAAYRFYVGLGGTVFATNTTISAISDARLKENVQDIDVGLDAILALKPRKFDWKAGKGKDIKGDRGFIAQEFETVFPNLIDEWKDPAPEGEAPYKSVRQDLIPVLVKAIQELTARVQTLEAR